MENFSYAISIRTSKKKNLCKRNSSLKLVAKVDLVEPYPTILSNPRRPRNHNAEKNLSIVHV